MYLLSGPDFAKIINLEKYLSLGRLFQYNVI